jgi:hypothetical protein
MIDEKLHCYISYIKIIITTKILLQISNASKVWVSFSLLNSKSFVFTQDIAHLASNMICRNWDELKKLIYKKTAYFEMYFKSKSGVISE